jgi:anthranilate phosphoribosyltransferase
VACLNAAASLVVASKTSDLREALAMSQAAIDSGKAKATLATLVASSNA